MDYSSNKVTNYSENLGDFNEKTGPNKEKLLLDSTLRISVSEDKLQASIFLTEPVGGRTMSADEIIEYLNKNGIQYGILKEKVEEVVNKSIFNESIIVAQGKEAVAGEDGKISYIFGNENTNRNVVVNEDGTIDYKNLNKIRNVNKGTLLLEIIPPREGINGVDIYGNEIIAKRGKEVIVKKGKNVEESEDGLKIYSTIDGEVYFVDHKIYVEEVITIDGDINNETGNIYFKGKVNIKGNVKSGFKVEADGDIEVWGVVEGAKLISNGNIMIHRGVHGNNQASLHSLGNLTAKYIENATVKSGGDITADAILHSDITAKGRITAFGRKGLIAGGDIRAGLEVRANIIGSSMGTITNIEVGIDPEEKKSYEEKKIEILNIEKNIEKTQKAIQLLNKMSKKQQLTKEKEELFLRSLNTYKVLKLKEEESRKEIEAFIERFKEANNGKVHAMTTIYIGAKITIGNCTKNIYDNLSNCSLYIKNAEITIGPYER